MSTAWYRTGTLALVQNSATVTGTGTQWANPLYGIAPGQMLLIPGAGAVVMYEIQRVVSDTQITLSTAYTGTTATGQQYAIVTALIGSVADFSRQLSVLVGQWQAQLDGWQKILTGSGDVTLTAPDGTSVTVKSQTAINTAVSNMLDKTKNLSDLPSAATARTYLGLKSGATAIVQTSATDATAGAVMINGAWGLGGTTLPNISNLDATTNQSGVYYSGSATTGTKPSGSSGIVQIINQGSMTKQFYTILGNNNHFVRTSASGVFSGAWAQFWTTDNTTVDTNGFLKKASPIVQLRGDGSSVLNAGSEPVVTERIDTGVYKISGIMGLNIDDKWHAEIPVDINKQPPIWIDYKITADGDMIVKTYHRTYPDSPEFARNFVDGFSEGDPIDIPPRRTVDIRPQVYGPDPELEPDEPTPGDAPEEDAPTK